MPTYEYECTSCGTSFERFESITAKPNGTCPKCKKRARRLIGAGAGLIFKGSGFYCTDYRSSSRKSEASKESKSGPAKDTAAASACSTCSKKA